ncbi:MAG: chemical-damaging agent resistance protein C [Alphaproteobacteria bacterium]|nr:chemical-damaging agent resistance protein C [Alphaproteobacteria bacterium]
MVDIFDPSYDAKPDIKLSDNRVSKGDDINLAKKDPTLTKLSVGVGWDLNVFDTEAIDLDVSCFMLDKHDMTVRDEDFIFYNNMASLDESIVHNGDNRTGAGEGDDETISIDLNGIHYNVQKIVFTLSIYRGSEKDQSLGKIRNSYIRLVNASNSQEVLRYDLSEDMAKRPETGMLVASLNREGPKWHFVAIGECVDGGLAKIASNYGMTVHGG